MSRYGGRYFQRRTMHHPVDRLPKINLDCPGCRSSWPAYGATGKGPVGTFIQRSAVHKGLPCPDPDPDPAGYITCVPWRFSQARAPQLRCVRMATYRGNLMRSVYRMHRDYGKTARVEVGAQHNARVSTSQMTQGCGAVRSGPRLTDAAALSPCEITSGGHFDPDHVDGTHGLR